MHSEWKAEGEEEAKTEMGGLYEEKFGGSGR